MLGDSIAPQLGCYTQGQIFNRPYYAKLFTEVLIIIKKKISPCPGGYVIGSAFTVTVQG